MAKKYMYVRIDYESGDLPVDYVEHMVKSAILGAYPLSVGDMSVQITDHEMSSTDAPTVIDNSDVERLDTDYDVCCAPNYETSL